MLLAMSFVTFSVLRCVICGVHSVGLSDILRAIFCGFVNEAFWCYA